MPLTISEFSLSVFRISVTGFHVNVTIILMSAVCTVYTAIVSTVYWSKYGILSGETMTLFGRTVA